MRPHNNEVMARLARSAARLAPALIAFVVYLGWYAATDPPTTGDEPHYVALALQLGHEGTVDLGDAYTPSGHLARVVPGIADDHSFDPYGDGSRRLTFPPGLAVMAALPLRVSANVHGVHVMMIGIAAASAQLAFALARRLLRPPRWALWLAWGGTFFSVPMLGFANQIYNEIPLSVLAMAGVWFGIVAPRRRLVWAAVALAAMPWFHLRGAPIAAALLVLVAAANRRRLAPILAPSAIMAAGLCLYSLAFYGSPLPSAIQRPTTVLAWYPMLAYNVAWGTFLRPSSGLVAFAPFLVVGLVGTITLARRLGPAIWYLIAVVVFHLVVVAPRGYFGFTQPGRFAIMFVPLLFIGAVAVIAASRIATVGAVALVAVSSWWIAAALAAPMSLYDTGHTRFTPVTATSWLWPTMNPGEPSDPRRWRHVRADTPLSAIWTLNIVGAGLALPYLAGRGATVERLPSRERPAAQGTAASA